MAARDGMLMRNEVVVVVVREKRASAEAFSITMHAALAHSSAAQAPDICTRTIFTDAFPAIF